MIFYFTGTGNSKYIADKLAACLSEKTVDIAKSVNNNIFTYDCSEENYIGFVFPVYGFGMPSIVKDFVLNMELDNIPEDAYVFAVTNCGGTIGSTMFDLNKILLDKNINLDYIRNIVFPDNYILMYDTPKDDELKKTFRSANIRLANIINNISRNKKSVTIKTTPMTFIFKAINFLFIKLFSGTSAFKVKDNCVGCGLCKDVCNSNVIEIENGKPVWNAKSCVHCLACIHRCPVEAIEYGSKTEGKKRYVNPYVKFEMSDEIREKLEQAEADNTDGDDVENVEAVDDNLENQMSEDEALETSSKPENEDSDEIVAADEKEIDEEEPVDIPIKKLSFFTANKKEDAPKEDSIFYTDNSVVESIIRDIEKEEDEEVSDDESSN